MGMATPEAGGGGGIIGERGRSWWKKSGWMGKVGKARIKRVETVGGVWWVGQGGAESLGEEKSSGEVAEAGGPGWGVRAEKADKVSSARLDWLEWAKKHWRRWGGDTKIKGSFTALESQGSAMR